MRSVLLAAAALTAAVAIAPARAAEPNLSLPLVGAETQRGGFILDALPARPLEAKTIDGAIGDWAGESPGWAGVTADSHGERLYTDHLFDAHGADDGGDRDALLRFEETQAVLPEAYRLEALMRNDPAGQVGAPSPEQLQYRMEYGDLGLQDVADLTELRLAAGPDGAVDVLARTTTMKAAGDTTLLLLIGLGDGERREVPGHPGLRTTAHWAVEIANGAGERIDLTTGERTALTQVAVNPDGYTNAIEARIEGLPARFDVAAATAAGDGPLANVAFRHDEPVREFFDRGQAFALLDGDIDRFRTTFDREASLAGATERVHAVDGYHERIFRSTPEISREERSEGILQHYGVYVPKAYWDSRTRPAPMPLQLWLHWRGGTAHSAGATIPGMFRDLGERRDTLVISPRGRGSSSWYVGRGHVDVEEVWRDAHDTFSIDPARRYSAGHSMGGWGTYLFTITHPDWFAAGLPASPPVTQGAWTGLTLDGCEDLTFEGYSPCYIEANGGRAEDQHTRRLLENLRHTPLAIFHGTADELVPVSGETRQVERLVQLGYRHRYYLFHTQEHFGPPVWDQWEQGAQYMHQFRAPANPPQVTYERDMRFERATEEVGSGGVDLDFSFDSAYWMSGLEPVDATDGVAAFDGRTLARPRKEPLTVPEAGAGFMLGQTGPYTMTGLRWADNPLATAPRFNNRFEAKLTGARAVTLDTGRMNLTHASAMSAIVRTGHPLTLRLRGAWKSAPSVVSWGPKLASSFDAGTLTIQLPAGPTELRIDP